MQNHKRNSNGLAEPKPIRPYLMPNNLLKRSTSDQHATLKRSLHDIDSLLNDVPSNKKQTTSSRHIRGISALTPPAEGSVDKEPLSPTSSPNANRCSPLMNTSNLLFNSLQSRLQSSSFSGHSMLSDSLSPKSLASSLSPSAGSDYTPFMWQQLGLANGLLNGSTPSACAPFPYNPFMSMLPFYSLYDMASYAKAGATPFVPPSSMATPPASGASPLDAAYSYLHLLQLYKMQHSLLQQQQPPSTSPPSSTGPTITSSPGWPMPVPTFLNERMKL